jgi:hypothetical protein
MARKRKRSTGKKKTITAKQKSARRKNIAVARRGKKKGVKKLTGPSADAKALAAQARGKTITMQQAAKARKGSVRTFHTSWGVVYAKK